MFFVLFYHSILNKDQENGDPTQMLFPQIVKIPLPSKSLFNRGLLIFLILLAIDATLVVLYIWRSFKTKGANKNPMSYDVSLSSYD